MGSIQNTIRHNKNDNKLSLKAINALGEYQARNKKMVLESTWFDTRFNILFAKFASGTTLSIFQDGSYKN